MNVDLTQRDRGFQFQHPEEEIIWKSFINSAAHIKACSSWTEHKNPTKTLMRLFHMGKGAPATPTLLCTYTLFCCYCTLISARPPCRLKYMRYLFLSLSHTPTHTYFFTQTRTCSSQLAQTVCKRDLNICKHGHMHITHLCIHKPIHSLIHT